MKTRKELARIAAGVESIAAVPTTRNTAHTAARDTLRDRMPIWARVVLAIGAGDRAEARAIRVLSQFPITACVGPNGGGKTLAMMVVTAPTRAGIQWSCDNPDHHHTARGETRGYRRMLSTLPILDGHGKPHPLYDPFVDFQQLVDVEHSDVYMDEVTSVASSRESQRMDARVLNKLMQLRKADVALFWTAPNWARADKVMREVTQCVIECRGYAPAKSGLVDGSPLWRPRRVFKFRMFDSVEFEEWTAAKKEKVDAINVLWFRGPGSAAFKAYDTLGAVSMVASITPEDTCTVCEGRITRHVCRGHGTKRDTPGAPPLEVSDLAAV